MADASRFVILRLGAPSSVAPRTTRWTACRCTSERRDEVAVCGGVRPRVAPVGTVRRTRPGFSASVVLTMLFAVGCQGSPQNGDDAGQPSSSAREAGVSIPGHRDAGLAPEPAGCRESVADRSACPQDLSSPQIDRGTGPVDLGWGPRQDGSHDGAVRPDIDAESDDGGVEITDASAVPDTLPPDAGAIVLPPRPDCFIISPRPGAMVLGPELEVSGSVAPPPGAFVPRAQVEIFALGAAPNGPRSVLIVTRDGHFSNLISTHVVGPAVVRVIIQDSFGGVGECTVNFEILAE